MSFLLKPFTDTISGVRQFFNTFFGLGPGGFWNTLKQIFFYGLIILGVLVVLYFVVQIKNSGGGGSSMPNIIIPPV